MSDYLQEVADLERATSDYFQKVADNLGWTAEKNKLKERIAELEHDKEEMASTIGGYFRRDKEQRERIADLEAENFSIRQQNIEATQGWSTASQHVAELERERDLLKIQCDSARGAITALRRRVDELKAPHGHPPEGSPPPPATHEPS